MKKTLAILAIVALGGAIIGCGAKTEDAAGTTGTTAAAPATTGTTAAAPATTTTTA